LIEADRVCNPVDKLGDPSVRDGVEIDSDGEPVAYHVMNRHPGDNVAVQTFEPDDWARIPARGDASNLPLMIHLFKRERVGGSRGIPALAPVIESLKQLDRYAEAELMAAVVSAFFTVFIKTTNGDAMAGIEAGSEDPRPLRRHRCQPDKSRSAPARLPNSAPAKISRRPTRTARTPISIPSS
jgi:capsid protein